MAKYKYISDTPIKSEPRKKIGLKIRDGSITTDKIMDGAVTPKKLSDEVKEWLLGGWWQELTAWLGIIKDQIRSLFSRVDTLESTGANMEDLNALGTMLGSQMAASLLNYYLKTETYNRDEIDNLVSRLPKFKVKVVSSLPTEGISDTTIYLIPLDGESNLYQEYLYDGTQWRSLGSAKVPLDNYATTEYIEQVVTQLSNSLQGQITTSISSLQQRVRQDLLEYYKRAETYSKSEVNELVSRLPRFNMVVVYSLPTENISESTIYLLKTEDEGVLFSEYIYANGVWVGLGSKEVNLSEYVKLEDLTPYDERITALENRSSDSGCNCPKHVFLTQREYDDLEVKDSNTLYFIIESGTWVFGDTFPIILS